MMAHAEHLLDFFEGGVGVFFDMGAELLRVELAPMSPALFRGQRTLLGSAQIPVNRTPGQLKPPGGFDFGTAGLNEFHHPLPQVQCIRCHALNLTSPCPNVNVKRYSSFNQHWHTADEVGLTCWSANPAAQQRHPTNQCANLNMNCHTKWV